MSISVYLPFYLSSQAMCFAMWLDENQHPVCVAKKAKLLGKDHVSLPISNPNYLFFNSESSFSKFYKHSPHTPTGAPTMESLVETFEESLVCWFFKNPDAYQRHRFTNWSNLPTEKKERLQLLASRCLLVVTALLLAPL